MTSFVHPKLFLMAEKGSEGDVGGSCLVEAVATDIITSGFSVLLKSIRVEYASIF